MNRYNITLYHGTNIKIEDGITGGSYFTENIDVAREYAKRKNGNIIYIFNGDKRHFYKDIFDEHYITPCSIPIDNFEIIYEKQTIKK